MEKGLNRRIFLQTSAGLLSLALSGVAPARAQTYPSRVVRVIVPYAAGGGPDLQARNFVPRFAEALGGQAIVENKVGAAGIVAAEYTASQAPDGYTILIGSSTHMAQKHMQPSVQFHPLESFTPISLTSVGPTVLIVAAASPYKTVQELANAIKAKPGSFNYGSGGIGTSAHLSGATFVKRLGLSAVHVPYKGSVDIPPALTSGEIQFAFPVSGTAVPQVKAGKMRALAVTGGERSPLLPEVPTLREIYGDDLLVQEFWGGLWVPKGTPAPIVQQLFDAWVKTSKDPSVVAFNEANAAVSVSSKSPQDFAAYMEKEFAKWGEIVRISEARAN